MNYHCNFSAQAYSWLANKSTICTFIFPKKILPCAQSVFTIFYDEFSPVLKQNHGNWKLTWSFTVISNCAFICFQYFTPLCCYYFPYFVSYHQTSFFPLNKLNLLLLHELCMSMTCVLGRRSVLQKGVHFQAKGGYLTLSTV